MDKVVIHSPGMGQAQRAALVAVSIRWCSLRKQSRMRATPWRTSNLHT
jgi:hypothetical protein